VGEDVRETPVLLLDDPFSALDPRRQRLVGERLVERGQVFVSVADDAHVPEGSVRVLAVSAGTVAVREG
jgi:recombinational DNA repair ATPase RecF